jgi:hypothetical protein
VVVYFLIGLVVILVLWAAYRAFGRPASEQLDAPALVRRAANGARDAAQRLDAAQASSTETPGLGGIRRQIDGCAQLLERVDTATLDDRLADEHASLRCAVEDLGWAARLQESAGFVSNAALRTAAARLRADAEDRLGRVGDRLQSASAAAEEIDGPT